ncbi:MAG: glycoside hydrolase family 3 protein [Chitinivibrionales bacterium]|nr:glycoside hydrolase family 3 protein [Chitinivibrionales bacterium]MBD3395788.1 glycoside hydrolase family 3 protein [Chitinivibrionales bacterium]
MAGKKSARAKKKTYSRKYQNPDLPVAVRVADLIARMTLEEKVSQMVHDAPAIKRLDIPKYDWWSEGLHGVARAGIATVFPQSIGMGASFDPPLLHKIARAISDEARAKHHAAIRSGLRTYCMGLTYWSPNINIFRDPRWGRGQETYGEDPYLTARMGVAFVKGLQGNDPRYLKLVATPKHYAVHSGPEPKRHEFDAVAGRRDMAETYLPAFKACVREGKAVSVMGAYNRTNGEPCCASKTLLLDILRGQWGFEGYVVSDCGAIEDIHAHHKVTAGPAESAALGVKNGCDLNCGSVYPALIDAVEKGLIDEATIDRALSRLLTARFRLGMFDPDRRVPYARIPERVVNSDAHRRLARRMAQESIVLLKNKDDVLPIAKDAQVIQVVGPVATNMDVLLGNYYGVNDRMSTVLEGIAGKLHPGQSLRHTNGSMLYSENLNPKSWGIGDAKRADVVVAVFGITPFVEGEEGDALASKHVGDRADIGLPPWQEKCLREVCACGKPVVLVLTSGCALSLPRDIVDAAHAIVYAWYPGQEGGNAVADVLFGDYNPAGRLPVTVPASLEQLPPFEDYNMRGRTYRFMEETPLFPFGFGLSYTSFAYSKLRLSKKAVSPGESVTVTVDVKNTGRVAGDEVVQLYVSDVHASVPVPKLHLEGFKRIHLKPKRKKAVSFTLTPAQLAAYDDEGNPFVEPGHFSISVGGGQPRVDASGAVSTMLVVTP